MVERWPDYIRPKEAHTRRQPLPCKDRTLIAPRFFGPPIRKLLKQYNHSGCGRIRLPRIQCPDLSDTRHFCWMGHITLLRKTARNCRGTSSAASIRMAVVRQFIKGTSVAAMITLSTLEGGHKRAKSPKSRLPLDTVLHRRRLWRELREVGMHALTGFRLRDRIDGADRRFWGEKPRARSRVRW